MNVLAKVRSFSALPVPAIIGVLKNLGQSLRYAVQGHPRSFPKSPSFQIRWGYMWQKCSSSKCTRLPDRISDGFSRRRPRRHFAQKSAAAWRVNTKRLPVCLPASMQQSLPVPDLQYIRYLCFSTHVLYLYARR